MNRMLGDEDLTRLLEEAAGGFAVPPLELPAAPVRRAVPRRVWLGGAGAAAALVVVGAAVLQGGGSQTFSDTSAKLPQRAMDGALSTGGTSGGATAGLPPLTPEVATLVGSGAVADAGSTRVVRTGTVQLSVDGGKVGATAQRVQDAARGLGGLVAESSSQEAGDHPSASVTVRVPVARFDLLLQRVRSLGAKVVSAQTSGKDVTADYADVQAQLETLRAARGRYLAILARAKTIGETLTVQQRVDDVQGQIDRLEGQRRVLADQSDLGTLTVSVNERTADVLVTAPRSGWSKAWYDARHGFSSGLQSLVAGSGTALLVLLIGAALLLLGRVGWRRARRRLV